MKRDEVIAKIQEIVVDQLGVEPSQVTLEANFINDLGADSLGTVELVMSLEEAFEIDIPDEKAEQIQTVGDALIFIEQAINS